MEVIRTITMDVPMVIGAGLLAMSLLHGATAQAGSLSEEADINLGLMEISVADEIRKRCDSISGRIFAGLRLMSALKDEAVARGYSEAEIEAYVTDKEEKRKMRARADAYIRAHGAAPNDGPSLCALGQDEIAKQSRIGALLWLR